MEKQKHIPVSEEKAMEKERQDRCWSLGEGKYVKVKVIPIHELESFLRDLQFERCSLCCHAVVHTSRVILFAGLHFFCGHTRNWEFRKDYSKIHGLPS